MIKTIKLVTLYSFIGLKLIKGTTRLLKLIQEILLSLAALIRPKRVVILFFFFFKKK